MCGGVWWWCGGIVLYTDHGRQQVKPVTLMQYIVSHQYPIYHRGGGSYAEALPWKTTGVLSPRLSEATIYHVHQTISFCPGELTCITQPSHKHMEPLPVTTRQNPIVFTVWHSRQCSYEPTRHWRSCSGNGASLSL